jgi:hypothetical protein
MKLAATATFRLMASTDTVNRRKRMMLYDCLVFPRRTMPLPCTRSANWPQWMLSTGSPLRRQRRSWLDSGVFAYGRPHPSSIAGLTPPPRQAATFCPLNSIAEVWVRRRRGVAGQQLAGGHRYLSARRDSGMLLQQVRVEAPSDMVVLHYAPMYPAGRG